MDKQLIAFRCPPDLLSVVDEACEANMMDRTAYITFALRNLLVYMGEQGVIQGSCEAPCVPKARKEYTGRKRGRKPSVVAFS